MGRAELAKNYAHDMGPDSQQALLLGVLPEKWVERIMDTPELNNPTVTTQYVQRQLRY